MAVRAESVSREREVVLAPLFHAPLAGKLRQAPGHFFPNFSGPPPHRPAGCRESQEVNRWEWDGERTELPGHRYTRSQRALTPVHQQAAPARSTLQEIGAGHHARPPDGRNDAARLTFCHFGSWV